jgi:hypothetical protein
MPQITYTARAEILADGRKRVHLTANTPWPSCNYTRTYTTVRNIDGSNRFISDDGFWSFMPHGIPEIAAALAALPQTA